MDINLAGEIDGIETAEEILDIIKFPILYMTAYDQALI